MDTKRGAKGAERPVRSGQLSFCQELLLLNQLRHSHFQPLIAEVVELRGAINPQAIYRALRGTVSAFESLRTRFVLRRGKPRGEVLSKGGDWALLLIEDGTGADSPEHLRNALTNCMNTIAPERGRSLVSLLYKRGQNRWLWLYAVHHLASDGWSQHLYGRYFASLLKQRYDRHDPVMGTSVDYARRQRAWYATVQAQGQLEWWICKVQRAAHQSIPLNLRSKPQGTATVSRFEMRLPPSSSDGLHRFASAQRVPMLSIFLAALAQTVSRRTLQPLVSVTSLVGGRMLRGAHLATGAFYNSILLTIDTGLYADRTKLLQAAASAVFEAWKRQEVPLGLVFEACARRRLGREVHNFPLALNLVQHPLSEFRIPQTSMWDLEIDTLLPPSAPSADGIRHLKIPGTLQGMTIVACVLESEVRLTMDIPDATYVDRDACRFLVEFGRNLEWFAAASGGGEAQSSRWKRGLIYSSM